MGQIVIRGAREHNLQSVNLDLPRDRLTVFTGPSGSGKSSLAFDTLHAEGQRRYLETLRCDTRALFTQLQRPDVDLIEGLPPTLCVAQQTGSAQRRSTLATLTEIHDHLRLLWSRLGIPYCLACDIPVVQHTIAEIVRHTLALEEGHKIYLLAPLVRETKGEHRDVLQTIRQGGFLRARIDGVLHEIRDIPKLDAKKKHTVELVIDRLVIRHGIDERLTESLSTAIKQGNGQVIVTHADDGDWHDQPFSTKPACPRCGLVLPEFEPRRFSFNNPYGACPTCTGLGQIWALDPERLLPDKSLTLQQALVKLNDQLPEGIHLAAPDRKTVTTSILSTPLAESSRPAGEATPQGPLAQWPPDAVRALLEGKADWPGWLPTLRQAWNDADDDPGLRQALDALAGYLPCPECQGARLNREARAVRFEGLALHELTARTVDEAADLFHGLATKKDEGGAKSRIRAVLVQELSHRLQFLQEVGLGYLTLDRPAPTLSGGEAQRARLATHLGGHLLGVCYILDEPTIGLHPRDTQKLIGALRGLQRRGNTVIVVEHDEEVMRQADYLVDIGPGAGRQGGQLLAAGTLDEVLRNPASVTAPFLRGAGPATSAAAIVSTPRPGEVVEIRGARHHNLKNIDVNVPIGRLVCVTGVSGSGKSSLARDILCHAARRHLGLLAPTPGAHDGIEGLEHFDKVIEVDQAPLGRSSRSSPATYTGVYDEMRKVFATTRLAKVRGYKSNRFSFNVKGGRCEECLGQGRLRVALQFLPDLWVPCPACHGKRFERATLEVQYRGRSIAEVLDMPIAEALAFFENIPAVRRPLEALVDVGLGYLSLGQPSSTLSGGEAQRVKLAAELARTATGRTLFLLDEPTTGLHFADVANLVRVLRKLVEAGNTLIVIEHHLDLIAASDWIIDLGPEGGEAGGYLLASGTPSDVARVDRSITGKFLDQRTGSASEG